MSFDDKAQPTTNDLVRALDLAAALLSTEARWCRRQELSADGRYCLIGALKATGQADHLVPRVLRAANKLTGFPYSRLDLFNDDLLTTHRHICSVLSEARRELLLETCSSPDADVSSSFSGLVRFLIFAPTPHAHLGARGPEARLLPAHATLAASISDRRPDRAADPVAAWAVLGARLDVVEHDASALLAP